MRRTCEPIETVVAEVLSPASIGEAVSIPHPIVGVGGLIDRGTGGAEFVENRIDWTCDAGSYCKPIARTDRTNIKLHILSSITPVSIGRI